MPLRWLNIVLARLNIVCMKKITVWTVAVVMGVCCVALLFLQLSYIETMVEMRRAHFEESVRRSLYRTSYRLDMNEMRKYLSSDTQNDMTSGFYNNGRMMFNHSYTTSEESGNIVTTFQITATMSDHMHSNEGLSADYGYGPTVEAEQRRMFDDLRTRYKYYRAALDEVIYNMLYEASELPTKSRIDVGVLEKILGEELANNGIDLPYNFRILGGEGREIYSKVNIDNDEEGELYRTRLFKNDPPTHEILLEVSFPQSFLNNYIYGSVKFMIPSLLFTFVLLITFMVTLYMAVRHKKITEMKNDFINNMTHEFKTPISTISLAAQMLQDPAVAKSPEMFGRLSGVISSETKRLRFQVDKVLQMSMFDDKNTASLKMKELDANELVSGIVNTFAVKVGQSGGTIESKLEADDPFVYVDEMHFTNVVFNLMDNAVKYRRADVPIALEIHTWNSNGKFMLSVKDNGIGIRKEDLKKIFDKFYRVHTGNVHDVKGFGLGLAYVKQIVQALHGTIRAESEPGVGTTFVIVLPLK